MCGAHRALQALGAHKQVANRLLEPWFHITTLVTATDQGWDGFFALRDHADADPTIRAVAVAAKKALAGSEPQRLSVGEWHLPYAKLAKGETGWLKRATIQSVARCARVSYSTFDAPTKESVFAKDIDLYDRLTKADPPHASPLEHVACAVPPGNLDGGNFGPTGWSQYRKQRRM
jgi:thymidylate synthase ThyX